MPWTLIQRRHVARITWGNGILQLLVTAPDAHLREPLRSRRNEELVYFEIFICKKRIKIVNRNLKLHDISCSITNSSWFMIMI